MQITHIGYDQWAGTNDLFHEFSCVNHNNNIIIFYIIANNLPYGFRLNIFNTNHSRLSLNNDIETCRNFLRDYLISIQF
jgi:hypothetical protein